jgi:hypothetical protein
MNNFITTNKERRYKAHVSFFGTTQLHLIRILLVPSKLIT